MKRAIMLGAAVAFTLGARGAPLVPMMEDFA